MSYAQAYCRVVQPGLGVLVAWSSETFKGLASGPDAENFSAADWTSALSSGAAILHGNGLGVLDIALLLALDTISFHNSSLLLIQLTYIAIPVKRSSVKGAQSRYLSNLALLAT
jgi:hypothetical protein